MKRISALTAAAVCAVISANAAAYGLYCENVTAAIAMADYGEDLISAALPAADSEGELSENEGEVSENSESDKTQLELYCAFAEKLAEQEYALAEKLIDYDVLMRKLESAHAEYNRAKTQFDEYSAAYPVGDCTKQQYDSAQKNCTDKYNGIKGLLFEISALKDEIEQVTGETLTADFDFSQAYLITDALSLPLDEISAYGTAAALCTAEDFEYSALDLTKQYNAAVKAYYALGEVLRQYVAAAQEYNSAQNEFKLGTISETQLETLCEAYESARLDAIVSKAEYAKSLLQLDKESGGALTANIGISGGLYSALDSALPESLKGRGLWQVRTNGEQTIFSARILPVSFDPEKDSGDYELRCGGKTLFRAPIGQEGTFTGSVDFGGSAAEVIFRVNGKTSRFSVDVFSPFGEFLEE